MKPVISVVIPTYNRERDLERALKSVIAQTYAHWEVLVVDNYSEDNTDSLLKSFNDPRLRLLKIHNNGVIAVSRNLGIRAAEGEYIAFLDSDDWWKPEKLEKSLKYLEAGDDVVYHPLYTVTKINQKIFWRRGQSRILKSPVFKDLITGGNSLANSSVVLRRQLLSEVGGLSEDESLISVEDFDVWLKVAKVTEKFRMIPEVLGFYWAGGGNVSNPERVLKAYGAFEERYDNELQDRVPWWLSYNKGRAYYLRADYSKAKDSLDRVPYSRVAVPVAIKSLWMKLLISLSGS